MIFKIFFSVQSLYFADNVILKFPFSIKMLKIRIWQIFNNKRNQGKFESLSQNRNFTVLLFDKISHFYIIYILSSTMSSWRSG